VYIGWNLEYTSEVGEHKDGETSVKCDRPKPKPGPAGRRRRRRALYYFWHSSLRSQKWESLECKHKDGETSVKCELKKFLCPTLGKSHTLVVFIYVGNHSQGCALGVPTFVNGVSYAKNNITRDDAADRPGQACHTLH